jgi:hypothetical protein
MAPRKAKKFSFPLLLFVIGFWMEKIPDLGYGINTS